MGLFLTSTRDQALLAYVIREAQDRSAGFVGRTAVQKLMYFLQALGVPVGYRFSIYHYGPYSDEIPREIDWLLADGVIVDKAGQQHYSNYAPGENWSDLVDLHRKDIESWRSQIAAVVNAMIPLSPNRLELLATLHYAYRLELAQGSSADMKDRVLARFTGFKGTKFADEDLSNTYDQMVRAGLVGDSRRSQ
jgi:uncharacterized protein